MTSAMTAEVVGRVRGHTVRRFLLRSDAGLELALLAYGGIVQSLRVPDARGRLADVVLGCPDLAGYLADRAHLGALVGRTANRIRGARYTIDGVEHRLRPAHGPHQLHGGAVGFGRVPWDAEPDGDGVTLRHVSPDGHEGHPGRLEVTVRVSLEGATLGFEYAATTDAPTHVSLTHHGYFQLAGEGAGEVLGHELTLHASRFTPVDDQLIPTGEIRSVAGTALDFREPEAIGARIDADDPQLRLAGGYDHNYVVDGAPGELRPAARVVEPTSGRVMEVETTEPGVQLYTGNHLDASTIGKSGTPHAHRTGLCLETQHYPDSPNQPSFPSTLLRPGERYRSRTRYRFSAL